MGMGATDSLVSDSSMRCVWRVLLLSTLLAALLVECTGSQHQPYHRHRHRHHHRQRIPIRDDLYDSWGTNTRDKRQWDPEDNEIESGSWGDWSGPSPCSRSCGGGVTYRSRSCTSKNPQDCTGKSKKYESCNVDPCPEGSKDFRAEQCQRYNSVPFEGKYYSWVPYLDDPQRCELNCQPEGQSWVPHLKAPRKCELNCQPEGERFYYRHALKVVDGTRCDSESRDICVDGKCMQVGCDHILGSSAQEDNCRVCGGDGSTCNTITGDFMQKTLTVGYNDIVLIPAGATNIYVEEVKASNNYLAVRNMTGFFYLNGNWRIDFPRARNFCGTTFHYERKADGVGIFAPEVLRAKGPTTEPLFIVILYQESNPGITYEYSVPKEVTQSEAETYDWLFGTYGECSVECGGGHMTRNVTCARTSDFQAVAEYLCDPRLEPVSNKTCNDHPCQASWQFEEWTPCTSSCGTAGWQFRHLYCGQKFAEGRLSIVNDSVCNALHGPKPQTVRECNKDSVCASWHVGEWTPCNKLCGVGHQFRKVRCHVRSGSDIKVLDDTVCSEEKPEKEKPCEGIPCSGVDWVASDWTGCGNSCSQEKETRSALCVSQKGKVVKKEFCSAARMPPTSRNCTDATECEFRWYASDWSVCSNDCGEGIKTRHVLCGMWKNNVLTPVPEVNCDAEKRFNDTEPCNGTETCKGTWFTGPWSRCNRECGGGNKHRKILCYVGNKQATAIQCDGNIIPYSIDSCNNNPCGDDEVLGMGSRVDVESEDDSWCDGDEAKEESGDGMDASGDTPKDTSSGEADSGSEMLEETSAEDVGDDAGSGEEETGGSDESKSESESDESGSYEIKLDVTLRDESSEEGSGFGPSGWGSGLSGIFPSGLLRPDGEITSGELDIAVATEHKTAKKPKSKPDSKKKKEAKKPAKCKTKPKPEKKDCQDTEFGCCQDNVTPASGPFQKGCLRIETCKDTTHGCCPDDVTPAQGIDMKGCPGISLCENSLFGCCQDGTTEASGPHGEGCEDLMSFNCEETSFGCCPDGVSPATGENFAGCIDYECEGSGPCESCNDTKHGCCPDGITAALGPDFEGCPDDSVEEIEELTTEAATPATVTVTTSPTTTTELPPDCVYSSFGCCPDNFTSAHGENMEGCCLSSAFGCCPDHITDAKGPHLQGCGCEYSAFGCCPDNETVARGKDDAGCGCQYTEYGCCPDDHTPAAGEDYSGCPCNTYPYGCCPDGVSIARGLNAVGCGCEYGEFGCCEDGRTPATGPGKEGCGCEASEFGCCPDGVTPATGKFFDGCQDEAPVIPGEVCGYEKDRGPCADYIVKWYFDMEYGGCTRFWYGGCDGNLNKFETQNECIAACVEPEGMESCHLPLVEGPCTGSVPSWYHDSASGSCKPFVYGGCLGNNNRYGSKEECEEMCVIPEKTDVCLLEVMPGPCRGNYTRWFYDQTLGICSQFAFGGCKGNGNNFLTENECMQSCIRGRSKGLCTLPKASGLCEETLPRWYYDYSETRCMPFYYTGCDGNSNRFITRGECEATCPGDITEPEEDVCSLPSSTGDCNNFEERWFFDLSENQCKSFVYGGCGGNNNNFASYEFCEKRCGSKKEIALEKEFNTEYCFLKHQQGTCRDLQAYWHYASEDGVCKQFLYGGCEGNENRFSTRQECEGKCSEAQDVCGLPMVVGPCNGSYKQYYYEVSTDECYEFDFGGCLGNKNRFDTVRLCQQRCKKNQAVLTTAYPDTYPEVDELVVEEPCKQPVDPGPCRAAIPSWYFDPEQERCIGFSYGGCEGNANRFQSVEFCERQCGKYRREDVCKMPQNSGPCDGSFRKWYHDPYVRRCKPFLYSGCEGNGNRFSTENECEAECIYHDTIPLFGNNTQEAKIMICEMDADAGLCTEGYKRWHFSKEQGSCIAFRYGGCGGNRNRFKQFNACTKFCATAIEKYHGFGSTTTDPLSTQSEPSGFTQPDQCKDSIIACQLLQCPYGIQERVDHDGCNSCSCYDPCDQIACSNGTQCAIDLLPSEKSSESTPYVAVCRKINKLGQCPKTSGRTYQCENDCENDAGCYGDHKCCYNGCGYSCVAPVREDQEPAYSPPPVLTTVPAGQAPRIIQFDSEVRSEENDVALLKCVAQGSPAPTIIWYRGSYAVDREGQSSRTRVLPDGSLQIVNTERGDSGQYTCEASNGIGRPATRTTQLTITDPKPRESAVVPWNEESPVVSLGNPTVLYCRAIGWPKPSFTWWRGRKMLPLSSQQYEQFRDGSLTIRVVSLRNLGPYTCQVYNGQGRATSQNIELRALGPVYNTISTDSEYLKYIVDPPKAPPTTQSPPFTSPATQFPAVRPDERPYWPPYQPPSIQKATTTPRPTTRLYIVPLRAIIRLNATEFTPYSTIRVPCEVKGYPHPVTTWFKGEYPIEEGSEKYVIEDDRTLVINDARADDSGMYKCQVQNEFGIADSTTFITIKGIYVHPTCTDNPFFANCKLIVRAKYCTNKYYARFCCRSCTLAGQLPSQGPHLPGSSRSSKRRK
ncbi:papilin-like isoform X4 [Homarus americanus]|uniref:papilin-like isoform X4 n=1 Tax=Homarus americanus TaxID=6706 RepID=UPI001C45F9FC|nr:papilin-like isoform X4 [Homarus americanus]